jgi:uncharacterized UPF0160 family protein
MRENQLIKFRLWRQQFNTAKIIMTTYNIQFNDSENSNDKGFELSLQEAKDYIKKFNGTNESYFEDYKGGVVSIIDNKTGETIYEEDIF